MSAPPVTSGLLLDLDAREFSELGTADSDPISTWTDQSGNGNDATGVGIGRPTFDSDYLGTGRPGVVFDGTDDVMALTTAISEGTPMVFAVVLPNTASIVPVLGHSVNDGRFASRLSGENGYAGVETDNGDQRDISVLTGAGAWFWIGGEYDSSIVAIVNNTASSPAIATAGASFNQVGRDDLNNDYNGAIAKLLVYNRILTGGEVGQLNTYFIDEFGV